MPYNRAEERRRGARSQAINIARGPAHLAKRGGSTIGNPGSYRLPNTVQPERYAIELRPDLERFTFTGEETIAVRVLRPVKTIVLNAHRLDVTRASLWTRGGPERPADTIELLKDAQRLRLTWKRTIPKGPASLRMTFSGVLNDELEGFYRSRYTMADGTTGTMAVTHFESTGARRAFPCWDEPTAKATFRLSVVVPQHFACISNTPAAATSDLGGGARLVRFEETPRMSTYLLVCVIGPLAAMEGAARSGTKVAVWAQPDRLAEGRSALEECVRILDYQNGYYGIPYPLAKLDHVGLPDFAAGAMENWGAITYRERHLLMDPSSSSAETRRLNTYVIAHETAHMWFGDLVTMAWWDDIWLNESFATWMSFRTLAALHPDWHAWPMFMSLATFHGLALDALRSSHPIEVPVQDPADIQSIFDDISYSKGASVLRMLEQFLGEPSFRRGIRTYLRTLRYGNARTPDLWRALGAASRKPVGAIMGTWTRQTGFPLLDVRVARTDGEARIRLTQTRFLLDHILHASRDTTRWKVPLQIARAGSPRVTRFVMGRRTESCVLGRSRAPPGRDWIKVNAGHAGFFRVNYPPEEWDRLEQAILSGGLPVEDRIGLHSDAHQLMRAGYLPATRLLEFSRAYRGEDDAYVWQGIANSMQDLETLVSDEPYLGRFDAYARDLYGGAASRAGWDPKPSEEFLGALQRTVVIGAMGHYGDRATLDEAASRFERYLQDPSNLRPELREVVYGLVAQEADDATYETLWDLERKATLQEEQVRLLVALSQVRDPRLLQETLRRSLTDAVRSQDGYLILYNAGVRRPSAGRDLTWSFIKANWDELRRRYAESGYLLKVIVMVAQQFTTAEAADDVRRFFRAHETPAVTRTVRQSVEKIRLNAAWRKKNGRSVARWFEGSST